MTRTTLSFYVGLFILLGAVSLMFLAIQVSGLHTGYGRDDHFQLIAFFDDVGGLTVRSKVTLSGVAVGRVQSIVYNPEAARAQVVLLLHDPLEGRLPVDTTASIRTAGLLGEQYVALEPGLDTSALHAGDRMDHTRSALALEQLIGRMMFSQGG